MQLPEQLGHVIGVLFKAKWAVNLVSVPVGLQFDGEAPTRFGEVREDTAETGLDGGAATVQQHDWPATAVDLVVHFQPRSRRRSCRWCSCRSRSPGVIARHRRPPRKGMPPPSAAAPGSASWLAAICI